MNTTPVKMNDARILILTLFLCLPLWGMAQDHSSKLHAIDIKTSRELMDFFKYTPDRIPFICAHRGGAAIGFPENSLEVFENTLRHTYAVMEVDPRFTKDGLLVLMHDATLDRTSTGKGKVTDYTLAELKKLKLKDTKGNITPYSIPTLGEALEWAKGKTVLLLDQKDVPVRDRVKAIEAHKAESCAMVMISNLEDAKVCYDLNPEIMMKVFISTTEEFDKFTKLGVPWRNVTVSVSPSLFFEKKDRSIIDQLHKKGAMTVMVSYKTFDKAFENGELNAAQLKAKYREFMDFGVDIIQPNLAIMAGEAIEGLQKKETAKGKYFK